MITILSQVFFTLNPPYTGGIWYVLFNIIYFLISYIYIKKKANVKIELNPYIYTLSIIILLFAPPLFENDLYRYIWEGKVLLSGFNPYSMAPNDPILSNLSFAFKEQIAFSNLTTIYPPLGLIWFGLFAFFPFNISVACLNILNAFFVYILIKILLRINFDKKLLLFTIPLLQKEFISSLHLDLIAASFFIYSVFSLYEFNSKKKVLNFYLLNFISFWSKWINIAALPYLVGNKKITGQKKYFWLLIIFPISFLLFSYVYITDTNLLSGANAFTTHWQWNPGFVSVLQDVFSINFIMSKKISFYSFCLLNIIYFIRFKKLEGSNPKYYLYDGFYFLFASMMFFSPVFNPWYAIWFLPFALVTNNKFGVYYAFFASSAYIAYGMKEVIPLNHYLCHIFFILSLFKRKPTA